MIGFHFGTSLDRVGDHVGDQPHRGAGREGVGPAREVLLDDVVLRRALELLGRDALVLGGDDVEREQPGGRRVDRHRRVHLVERDVVQQRLHVALVRDRHADLADLAARQLVVGVVAGLRRQVERDREARLALREVAAVQLVRLLGGRMAGVGPHHPRTVGLGQAVGGPGVVAHALDCKVQIRGRSAIASVEPIDVRHLGLERVICCWQRRRRARRSRARSRRVDDAARRRSATCARARCC